MKKHVLLTLLFLFVAAIGFSLVEERPPTDNIKIETSLDQDLNLNFVAFEVPVLMPINFVEVEISPGDLLSLNVIIEKLNLNTNMYAAPIDRPFDYDNINTAAQSTEKNRFNFLNSLLINHDTVMVKRNKDNSVNLVNQFDYSCSNKLLEQICQTSNA
jgi:hypothetical protein